MLIVWHYIVLYALFGAVVIYVIFRLSRAFLLFLVAKKRIRQLWIAIRVFVAFYILVLAGAFLWQKPWHDEYHWKNMQALKLKSSEKTSPLQDYNYSSVADHLAARLEHSETLVVMSLSGGGSRAAYFAAAVLEQLSKVRMPGMTGPGSSLVNHIDVLSTVSGGSVAGAYFAAHVPARAQSTDKELASFFSEFKAAMASDFEQDVAWQILNPIYTLAYLIRYRSGAEKLSEVFDRRLFEGQNLTYEELSRREREDGVPLLIVNAVDLSRMDLFAFTEDHWTNYTFTPTQRPEDALLGESTERLSTLDYRNRKALRSFDPFYGDLDGFRVADAVAASAAYPLVLGTIRLHDPWNLSYPTTYLGDAGLVDNSGLVSLYTHVFDRRLFLAAKGKLKRIIVIAIDAGVGEGEGYRGPISAQISALLGTYDRGQQVIQQFVVPEMLRRAVSQELGDLLEDPAWKGFQLPVPRVLSYSSCAPPVQTSFRLSANDRAILDEAARTCVLDQERRYIARLLDGKLPRRQTYPGVLGPSDIAAWTTLFRLVQAQRLWRKEFGRYATIEEARAGKMTYRLEPNTPTQEAQLDFRPDLSAEGSGYFFESELDGDTLLMYATPVQYKQTGRISLVFKMTDELFKLDGVEFCLELDAHFYGGDLKGQRATTKDEPFLPYGFHTYQMCL